MKRLIYFIFMLAPLFFGGCQKDDVFEIFTGGTWRVVNYYTTSNWDKTYDNHALATYTPDNKNLEILNSFTVVFNEDGTMEGNLQTQRFTGNWSANPDDRSVSITHLSPSSDNLTGMSKDFIQKLENVRYYKGDSRTLMLAPESRTSYVQLTTVLNN